MRFLTLTNAVRVRYMEKNIHLYIPIPNKNVVVIHKTLCKLEISCLF